MPTIGLVSPGAMGAAIGARLMAGGAKVLAELSARSPASIARAQAGGIVDAPFDALVAADLFLSIVPPASALEVAGRFARAAQGKDRPALYVDCNALSPETKRQVAAIVEAAGARCVDACIIGLPADAGGPTLYVSGADSGDAALLGAHGLRVIRLEGAVGAAAALKMCYSGMNKGLLALAGMMILAAERAGVGEALGQELARSAPQTLRMKQRLPSTFDRAWRWAPEMREIGAFAGPEDAGEAFEGIARFWERIAADHAGDAADQARLIAAMAGWPAP